MDLPRALLNRIERLERMMMTLAQRVNVQQVDDSTPIQTVQVQALGSEVLSKLERIQPLGLASLPSGEADGVVVFVGADRSHGILLSMEEQGVRPVLPASGDAALYAPGNSALQVLVSTGLGAIELHAAAVEMKDPATPGVAQVTIDGDLIVNGNITAATGTITGAILQDSTGTMAAFRSAYNIHTHVENDSGGPTDPPIPTA